MMGLFGYGFGPGAGFIGAGAVGMLLMALFWIGLIALALWAIRRLFPRERRTERDVAREVIGRRYAAGQITDAEYRQAMRTLGAE
ncbi:MAG TPA: hypothetical protein VE338_16950 [Ktedonobacterales bacterium]|jgi:uncharacterized membrane protein|nr:hypothetical protein [Ktedonobacterales bacterium]